jgi:hypothetical protein
LCETGSLWYFDALNILGHVGTKLNRRRPLLGFALAQARHHDLPAPSEN